jgi:hypothetical protein
VRKIIGLIVFSLMGLLPTAALAQQTQPIRINCGGPGYSDSKGNMWQADAGFTGGTQETIATAVSGTRDPTLFQSYHWNPTSYSFQVPNGQYHVNLYFTEAHPQTEMIGGRVFNVSLQGAVAFAKLDVFAAAGANAALIKSADVTVTNGTVAIGFTPVSGLSPKISAIEIVSAVPSLTLNFVYPDGSQVSGNLNYSVSSSLLSFQGAMPLVAGQAQCVLLANPSALGISAQFTVSLNLTDTAGHLLWQVNLGMNPSGVNLGAVQSSMLNVTVQKL